MFLNHIASLQNGLKRKIVGKGFVENVGYTSSHKIVKRDNGGNKSTEYMLTGGHRHKIRKVRNIRMSDGKQSILIAKS